MTAYKLQGNMLQFVIRPSTPSEFARQIIDLNKSGKKYEVLENGGISISAIPVPDDLLQPITDMLALIAQANLQTSGSNGRRTRKIQPLSPEAQAARTRYNSIVEAIESGRGDSVSHEDIEFLKGLLNRGNADRVFKPRGRVSAPVAQFLQGR
jgi:hypothetical protein